MPGGVTRFEAARQLAVERLRGLPSAVETSVVLGGLPSRVLVANAESPLTAVAALQAVAPRHVPSDIDSAVVLAAIFAGDTHRPEVWVFSDQAQPGEVDDHRVRWYRIGRPVPNAGVARVEPGFDDQTIMVSLYSTNAGRGRVTVAAGDTLLAQQWFELRERFTEIAVSLAEPAVGPLRISLEPEDAFPLDNDLWVIPRPAARVNVQLVTAGYAPLEAALDQPNCQLEITPPEVQARIVPDVVVLDHPGDSVSVPSVPCVVIGGADPFGLTRPAITTERLRPTQWRADDPLLRDIDVLPWFIGTTSGWRTGPRLVSVVEAEGVPLVMVSRDDAARPRYVFINFELARSNLAARASFPLLLWNAIEWMTGRDFVPRFAWTPTGSPLDIASVRNHFAVVAGPAGDFPDTVWASDTQAARCTQWQGVYRITEGDATTFIAANFAQRPPSLGSLPVAEGTSPASRARGQGRIPVWRYLAVAFLCAGLIEYRLFHRRLLPMH